MEELITRSEIIVRSTRTQNAIVICMHMNDEHRKAYEGKPHVRFDEEGQNLSALYSSRGAVKTAGYKTMPAAIRADAAASFQPGSHQVFQPSIQRIFKQNIQLTSSQVSSQASRNSSGNHVKLSQSAGIRSTGRECLQGRSPKSAGTPPECRHASNSSIDGKPFPAFLLHSLFLGKILTPYVGQTKFN